MTDEEKQANGKDYSGLKKPCCLIAEDAGQIQKYYSSILPKLGVSFVMANDGTEALEMMQSIGALNIKPDFIITDIAMPGTDGIELIKRIKEKPEFASIPVIIISAVSDDFMTGVIVKAFRPHAFLTKPIDTTAFIKVIQEIIA